MRRSKLERQFDILHTLSQEESMNVTHIMHKTNINYVILTEYMDFLIKQEIVEKINTKSKKITYKITDKGLTILRYFRKIDIELSNRMDKTRQV